MGGSIPATSHLVGSCRFSRSVSGPREMFSVTYSVRCRDVSGRTNPHN